MCGTCCGYKCGTCFGYEPCAGVGPKTDEENIITFFFYGEHYERVDMEEPCRGWFWFLKYCGCCKPRKMPFEKIYFSKAFTTYKYGYPSDGWSEDGTLLQNYLGFLKNEVEPFNLFLAHKCNPLKAWHRFFLFSIQFAYTLFIDAFLSETEIPDSAVRTIIQILLTSLIMDPLTFFMKNIATLEMCEKAISDGLEKSGRDELEEEGGKGEGSLKSKFSLVLCCMHAFGDSIFALVAVGFLALVLGLAVGVKIVNMDSVWIDTYFRSVFLSLGVAWLKKIVADLPNWYVEDWEQIPVFSSIVNKIPFCKMGLKFLGLYQETYLQSKERFQECYPGAMVINNTRGKVPNFDGVFNRLKLKCFVGEVEEAEADKGKGKDKDSEKELKGLTDKDKEEIKWQHDILQREIRHAIKTVAHDPSNDYRRVEWCPKAKTRGGGGVDLSAIGLSWNDPSTPLQDQLEDSNSLSEWLSHRTATGGETSVIRLLLFGKNFRRNLLAGVQIRRLVAPPAVCKDVESLQSFLEEYGEKPLDVDLAGELARDVVELLSLSDEGDEELGAVGTAEQSMSHFMEKPLALAVTHDDHDDHDDDEHWKDADSVDETQETTALSTAGPTTEGSVLV